MRPRDIVIRASAPLVLAALICSLSPLPAAALTPPAPDAAPARALGRDDNRRGGRPTVVLDRLDFPKSVKGWWSHKKFLRRHLKKQLRRADWGAGRGARNEVRYAVTRLDVEKEGDVLRVTCRAMGRLPRGKAARGSLRFSGDPAKRNKVIRKVLEIVSRGVITRLSELERKRRGDIPRRR